MMTSTPNVSIVELKENYVPKVSWRSVVEPLFSMEQARVLPRVPTVQAQSVEQARELLLRFQRETQVRMCKVSCSDPI